MNTIRQLKCMIDAYGRLIKDYEAAGVDTEAIDALRLKMTNMTSEVEAMHKRFHSKKNIFNSARLGGNQ